jgi:RNA polymerase sigma-70 factor, ECF subfamily
MHVSDEDLLAFIAAGDEAALDELYGRFGRVAFGLALRVLRDPGLAEDAVQDAFLDIWRSAGRFRSERGRARTWVLTLAHRRAVDLVRRRPRVSAALLADVAPAEMESAEEAMWLRLERRRVQSALALLSSHQRQLLELAYFGGLTQSEIAAQLGLPIGTVKSGTWTALTRLRDLLDDEAHEGRAEEVHEDLRRCSVACA